MTTPVSTHIIESGVILANIQPVWNMVSAMNFSWWSLVERSELVSGTSPRELDACIRLHFKDGQSWVIAVRELSSITNSITFEVIEAEPASIVASVVHTISLRRVSANSTTFVEWTTDFSSDATSQVVMDSSFKRQEAIADLARAISA